MGTAEHIVDNAISIRGLRKSFRPVSAVDGVSLEVCKGELFGIIGPDGAGKTTLFRLLATLLDADGGEASVDGLDIRKDYRELRKRVGYMPGKFSLYQDLSVKENLEFFASVFGTSIRENYDLIGDIYCRLEPFSDRKAGKLSGGMKQKLALCCALIHSPSVLFLDEPTTGVDPSSRREFWEMLAHLKSFGITMLVSTAYMDEASKCDRVALMSGGRFRRVGTVGEITGAFGHRLMEIRSDDMFRLLADVRKLGGVEECYTFGGVHHIRLKDASPLTAGEIRAEMEGRGHSGVEVQDCMPTLEDCFLVI
ncbi:MAG: ATP-binding cassette domain-containing protein [Bacteroidia bacterium]|nr:ATP-binding cassette domain-containing protein [Bacteroidia bacterium]